MNKVVEFLNANPVQYLATVGRDGKAKCRPFMFAGELDGRLWFCTNNQKDVYKDMQQNPEVEISQRPGAHRPGRFLHRQGCTGSTGLLCGRGLHRLQAVLFRLPAEVHRHYQEACGD